MTATLEIVENDVLEAIDARTSLHSIDTTRDGVATYDLGRLYALITADLQQLEIKFAAAERMAVISLLQAAQHQRAGAAWHLHFMVEDALKFEQVAEQFNIDGPVLLEKVSALTKSEMLAFSDAAARWWNAIGEENAPEQGDLFVGITRP